MREVEWKGERRSIRAWAKARGMTPAVLRYRLMLCVKHPDRWDLDRAMTEPAIPKAKIDRETVLKIREAPSIEAAMTAHPNLCRDQVRRIRTGRAWKSVSEGSTTSSAPPAATSATGRRSRAERRSTTSRSRSGASSHDRRQGAPR